MHLSRRRRAAPYRLLSGNSPVLISLPHVGTFVPPDIKSRLSEAALDLPDTDWHLDRLYDWAHGLGCSILMATHSRYVIDLNRPSDDTPLYAGETTRLCPTTLFSGRSLYLEESGEPRPSEIVYRRQYYWRPYHDRLGAELSHLRDKFGVAVLFDAHSIRSVIPRLFEGRLPDLNLGTYEGKTADQVLENRVYKACVRAEGYSQVRNDRFKGGYITRHYGRPASGIHALQLELAQRTYMEERPPFTYLEDRAAQVQPVLKSLVATILEWCEEVRR